MKKLLLAATHALALAIGFGLGIYTLPILVAPEGPTGAELAAHAGMATWKGEFRRNLKGSDALHWGEGAVSVGPRSITLAGKLAPGPNYKLYLSPEFVETEPDFRRVKPQMVQVGDVKTFDNFMVPLPASVDPARYTTVIIWCETFEQFITAARYR
ncbi:MAG: DM13 domain-containing protein [Pseudomonadota bacterium]